MQQHFAHLFPTPKGLALAGEIIASRNTDGTFAVKGREKEIHALLSAAYGKPVSARAINYINRGSELLAQASDEELDQAAYPYFPSPHAKATSGNDISVMAKSLRMFALTGLNDMDDVVVGKARLKKMHAALQNDKSSDALLKAYGLPAWEEAAGDDISKYSPDQPRVPAGNPDGGEWTSGGGNDVTDTSSGDGDNTETISAFEPADYQITQAVPAKNFSNLQNNYPTYDTYPTTPDNEGQTSIWDLIGGKAAQNGDSGIFQNSCAVRLSYALNQSGYTIPYSEGETVSGQNGDWYYYRVNDLADYLQNTYGTPEEYHPATWKTDLAGQTGIVLFEQHFKDANGHFELFNGSRIINYDDTRAPDNQPHDYSKTASKILFWPLK